MPPRIALLACTVFVLWLFYKDRTVRPMTSGALWIVLLWMCIVGSRPISMWFGAAAQAVSPDEYLEGSPLDRGVFLILMATGWLVLWRRKVSLHWTISANRWVTAYFLYCLVSVLWSDYGFVSFKRWVKDAGNLIMMLIVMTEVDPGKATKAVFARFVYLIIPPSAVLIKYVPNLGRYYNRWTWEPAYCGVTTEKNTLGCVAFVCGLYLVWEVSDTHAAARREGAVDKPDFAGRIVLLMTAAWVVIVAGSSTAMTCMVVGACILLFMRAPLARALVRHLGLCSALVAVVVFLVFNAEFVRGALTGVLGRDMTLTGRSDLWMDLMREPINPVFGTGYQSFWLGTRAEALWTKYSFHPNQAHNGYIETYLNCGWLGVCLLVALLIAAGRNLKGELLRGGSFGLFRFACLATGVLYNFTEATFNRLGPVWCIVLLAALKPWGRAQGDRPDVW